MQRNMRWYHINFSNSDLTAKNDEKFIRQFVKLLHTLKHPDELALFSLKFSLDNGLVYYTSVSEEHSYKLKEVLSHYTAHEVSRPNLKVLTLHLGKTKVLKEIEQHINSSLM